ncbi:MAG TPA: archaeosortase/exosortase family protein [Chitinophagaceae bacterium]|nr:archaeosortase/exosortase family protein [Chitinophagaceae bacterium]MCC6635953.1 archaeosortase/exosortase family protein [Chitinophagaceae bacterium]HMZ45538.1 archaeosortase/exosortase family protein [Chitinophagaceae bacterium]HNE92960.1 archaeosortase/exosortase family protein [Chitinophagaceae bacterium]HNF28693.1 archaeosortase/exosortase family protein [Chitinophagaceae bacterium]
MANSFFQTIPSAVKKFLLRSIVFFIIWKLIYHLVLYPIRVPDKQLTHITAVITKEMIQFHYPNDKLNIEEINYPSPKENLLKNNKKIVGIADGCNGLELYILYIGFLACFPSNKKRLFAYAITGIVLIFVLNNIRSYVITLLNIHNSSFTDVAHHYFFKIFIYAVMFLLWVKYTKPKLKDE